MVCFFETRSMWTFLLMHFRRLEAVAELYTGKSTVRRQVMYKNIQRK